MAMLKANVRYRRREFSVSHQYSNGTKAPCHYCEEEGKERLVIVVAIEFSATPGMVPKEVFKGVANKLQKAELHGRGVCHRRACNSRFDVDQKHQNSKLKVEVG